MMAVDGGVTVGELVAERPARSRVFEAHGIDYCCGGGRTLVAACAASGVPVATVLADLRTADETPAEAGVDWRVAPLSDLTRHLVETHHAYLRRELPRLTELLAKVQRAHGERHAWLDPLGQVYGALRAELESHLMKEENILFPMIGRLAAGDAAAAQHCGSVANPIRQMVAEHDDAGDALARLRELTSDYAPPEGACNTFLALLSGLQELEADLHQHIHKENNILFPRALKL